MARPEDSMRCPARFTPGGKRCERQLGHPGKHEADNRTVRWGGRYARAELNGKPGAMKDADKDRNARLRKPRGQRCSVCCQVRDRSELHNGQCTDKISCAEVQPFLFGAEALP